MNLIQKRKVIIRSEPSKYLGLGLNMSNPPGYGVHVKMKMKMKTTLLRSKPALRWSYEGPKKGGIDATMFKMRAGVSKGAAGLCPKVGCFAEPAGQGGGEKGAPLGGAKVRTS